MPTIANLIVSLSANAANLLTGVDNSTRSLNKFNRDVGAITDNVASKMKTMFAIAAGGGFLYAIKETAKWGEEIKDTSIQLGISTGALQKYQFAAEVTGSSLEAVTKSIRIMEIGLEKASDVKLGKMIDAEQLTEGTGNVAAAVQKLGLNLQQLRNEGAAQSFEDISNALNEVKNSAERLKLEKDIFGKSAFAIDDMIRSTKELKAEFDRFGIKFDDADIRKLDEANRQIKLMEQVLKHLSQQVIVDAMGTIVKFVTLITDVANAAKKLNINVGDTAVKLVASYIAYKTVASVVETVIKVYKSLNAVMKSSATLSAFLSGIAGNWVGLAAGTAAAIATYTALSYAIDDTNEKLDEIPTAVDEGTAKEKERLEVQQKINDLLTDSIKKYQDEATELKVGKDEMELIRLSRQGLNDTQVEQVRQQMNIVSKIKEEEDAHKKVLKVIEDQNKEREKLLDESRTPQQKLVDELLRLKSLGIRGENYDRLKKKYGEEATKENKPSNSFVPIIEKNTSAMWDMIKKIQEDKEAKEYQAKILAAAEKQAEEAAKTNQQLEKLSVAGV